MDMQQRKKAVIAEVRQYIRKTEVIPSDPERAADALYCALLQEWDSLGDKGRRKLVEAMAILCRHHGAEERAEAATKEILSRLTRKW